VLRQLALDLLRLVRAAALRELADELELARHLFVEGAGDREGAHALEGDLNEVARFARRGVRTSGKQSDWKKAIVTLAPGQKIELGGVNYFEQ